MIKSLALSDNKIITGIALLSLLEFVFVSVFVLASLFVPNKPILHPNVFQWSSLCIGSTWIWCQTKDYRGVPFFTYVIFALISITVMGLTIHRVQPLSPNQVYFGQVTLGQDVIRNVTDVTYGPWKGWFDWYKVCVWAVAIVESLILCLKLGVFALVDTEKDRDDSDIARLGCAKFTLVMDPFHAEEEEIKSLFHNHTDRGKKKQEDPCTSDSDDEEGPSTKCCATRDFAEFLLLQLLVLLTILFYLDSFTVLRSVIDYIPYWTDGESPGYLLAVGTAGLLGYCLSHTRMDSDKRRSRRKTANKHLIPAMILFAVGACVSTAGIAMDCRLPNEYQVPCASNIYYVRFATGHPFRTFKYEVSRTGLNMVFGRLSIANHVLKIGISTLGLTTLIPLGVYYFQDQYNQFKDNLAKEKTKKKKKKKSDGRS
jgi:hypothetical protein